MIITDYIAILVMFAGVIYIITSTLIDAKKGDVQC